MFKLFTQNKKNVSHISGKIKIPINSTKLTIIIRLIPFFKINVQVTVTNKT